MKVTILFHTSPRKIGGGTKVLYEYANYLSEKGHAVEIAYMANQLWSNFHIPEPIRRILARASIAYRPRWFNLNSQIKKYPLFSVNDKTVHDGDVIIATDVRTAEPVAKKKKKKGKKFYFIQDYENWALPDKEVQKTYSLNLNNITVSNWLSGIVKKYSGIEPIYIPNGINTDVFFSNNKIINRKPHSIVFQYRSNKAKGCKYAIEVCKRIQEIYGDAEINVISNEDRPTEIPDSFKFHHNITQNEVAEINRKSVVFICTSIDEGFGLPGLEAMACGCAVVSTAYTGVFEYAIDGENALLSPVKNIELMVKNIIRIFSDINLQTKLSINGIKTGKERSLLKAAFKFEQILLEEVLCTSNKERENHE